MLRILQVEPSPKSWFPRWPRSPKLGEDVVKCRVVDVCVDFSGVAEAVERDHMMWSSTWKALQAMKVLGEGSVVNLLAYFEMTADCVALKGLTAQFLWQVALLLEKRLGGQVRRISKAAGPIAFKWCSSETLLDGVAMEQRLLQYVMNSKMVAHSEMEWSLATYKGSVHTLGLQTTLFASPSNVAFVVVPQVDLVSNNFLAS